MLWYNQAGNESTATATVTVKSNVAQPTASGAWPASVVYNTTTSYSINAVAGASGYNWVVPQGFEVVAGQNTSSISVRVFNGTASGKISVRAVGACGEGSALTSHISATKATATVSITDIIREFTVEPRHVTVTTNPAGLQVNVLYNGTAIVPSAIGEYEVKVIVVNYNYTAEATTTLTINAPTAISEHEVIKGLRLYPNPMTGKSMLEIESGGTVEVVIKDVTGRIIHKATVISSYEVSLEGQSAGMYFLKVQPQGKPAVLLKLIKQ